MTTARRALSVALLGSGMVTAVWLDPAMAATAALVAVGTWAVVGGALALIYWEDASLAFGPLAWLWLLLVAPWLESDEEGPDGF